MKKVFKNNTLIYSVLLVIIVLMQIYKATLGVGISDEHFYITLGEYFAKGQSLLYEEWHIAQLISIFLAPLYSLYTSIFNGTDGIVLGFRIMYILFNAVVSVIIYKRFNKYGLYGIIAALAFALFTPFNIQALSYNTMSVMFELLSIILLDYGLNKNNKLCIGVSGLLYACAVLNTPYLTIIFVGLVVLNVYKLVSDKMWKTSNGFKYSCYFTGGIVVMFCIFMGLVLSRASISNILDCVKYFVDPSHSSNILRLIIKDGYGVVRRLHIFIFIQVLLVLWVFIKQKTDKKYLNLNSIITIVSLSFLLLVNHRDNVIGGMNIVLLPFTLLGIHIAYLYKSEEKILDYLLYVGIIHGMMLSLSSNVGYRSFLSPLILLVISVILRMKSISIKDMKYKNIVIIVFMGCLVFNAGYHIYGSNVSDYKDSVVITKGPFKGLKSNQKYVDDYYKRLDDLDYINNSDEEYASLITNNTWMYLGLDKNRSMNASYIYFYHKEEYYDCLNAYWGMHSDKLPTMVYVDKELPLDMSLEDEFFKQMELLNNIETGVIYIKK